jgi:hypothetical protein
MIGIFLIFKYGFDPVLIFVQCKDIFKDKKSREGSGFFQWKGQGFI